MERECVDWFNFPQEGDQSAVELVNTATYIRVSYKAINVMICSQIIAFPSRALFEDFSRPGRCAAKVILLPTSRDFCILYNDQQMHN